MAPGVVRPRGGVVLWEPVQGERVGVRGARSGSGRDPTFGVHYLGDGAWVHVIEQVSSGVQV